MTILEKFQFYDNKKINFLPLILMMITHLLSQSPYQEYFPQLFPQQ